MIELAFVTLAGMLVAYVILDGYDLGVGSIVHWYGRTPEQRALAIEAIGPFWSGNEVWLIAAGATLFALFPFAFAVAFSGFYLPLMVSLWLLMGRGIALELRGHFDLEVWHEFWDATFAISSGLLSLIFGVALGNIVRGLPLGPDAFFVGSFSLLLNPYAVATGVLAVCALALHGSLFLNVRVPSGALRTQRMTTILWLLVVALYAAVTAATVFVRPLSGVRIPIAGAIVLLSLGALAAVRLWSARRRWGAAFGASCAFIASLMGGAVVAIFPYLVPSAGSHPGVSIYDREPAPAILAGMLIVIAFGMAAVLVYGIIAGKSMWKPIGPVDSS